MRLSFTIARRYLLAPRSQNAINLITLISMVVMAVVTAAMIVVLSTLNGIADLVDSMYSPFDQDITISPVEGKTIQGDDPMFDTICRWPEVLASSRVIEENVLLRSGDQQRVATMKGVEPSYLGMARMDQHMYAGEASLGSDQGPAAMLGIGLKVDLGAPLDDGVFKPLEINAPVRGRKLSKFKQAAFEREFVPISGAFSINLEFDSKYVLVPIELAADLLEYDTAVSAIEIQLQPEADADAFAARAKQLLGPSLEVKTRHQKNALMYKTNASEKWFTFLVLAFIALIGAFNIIASLTMLMIEKKKDMYTLVSMGATMETVRNIFFLEGILIAMVGTISGIILGLGLCALQQHFGLIELTGSIVDAYPVKVLLPDLLLVFFALTLIGIAAAYIPLRSLSRRYLQAASRQ